jgi:hypothetical protein
LQRYCGFPKLKLRLKNTTPTINGVAQDMTGGTLIGVVKFSRNRCYTADLLGDPGELNTGFSDSACLLDSEGQPAEDIVVSAPVSSSFALNAGQEQQITLDFSANPVPVNAWNARVQLVYRGGLGLESDAVVTTAEPLTAPSAMRFTNETNYLLINQQLYLRSAVNTNQTLLAQVRPTSCVIGSAGTRSLSPSCFNPYSYTAGWRSPTGQVLASISALPAERTSVLLFLGNPAQAGIDGATFDPFGIVTTQVGTRVFAFDEGTQQATHDPLYAYRGMPISYVSFIVYFASTDQTFPPEAVIFARPAFANTTPIPFSTINF